MEQSFAAAMAANKESQRRILERHFENGVIFLSDEGIIIEEGVVIGPKTVIEPGVALLGKTVIGAGCRITSGSRITDTKIGDNTLINATQCTESVIGNNVSIGPYSQIRPDCVIKDGVKIGDFVEVKNSVIGEKTAVAHLTYVGDSDVGDHVNFGCGCVTVNYDGVHKNRCRIGNRAFIGCNCNLIAPVTVGDDTFLAAGSTITDDIENGDFAIARARQVVKPGLGAKKLADRVLK